MAASFRPHAPVTTDEHTVRGSRHDVREYLYGVEVRPAYDPSALHTDADRSWRTDTQQDFTGRSRAKEQSSCSEWTGILLQTEHCYRDWKTLMGAFGSNPAGPSAWVGL